VPSQVPSGTPTRFASLEDRGLLTRYICPTDRRGIYTDVTHEGRTVLDAARPTNEAALQDALDELEQDEALGPFVHLLRAGA
jgi:DNA-binding MarR family transcriptional regulator